MSILNWFHKEELGLINDFPSIKKFLLKIENIAKEKRELIKESEIDKIFRLKEKIKQVYNDEKLVVIFYLTILKLNFLRIPFIKISKQWMEWLL